jgi:hypothetical protein
MGVRTERLKRALDVGRVARRTGLLRVLRELGVRGSRPATRLDLVWKIIRTPGEL